MVDLYMHTKKMEWMQRESPFHLIEIEKWHNPGACFWFMPVNVIDVSKNCRVMDNLECMKNEEISIS